MKALIAVSLLALGATAPIPAYAAGGTCTDNTLAYDFFDDSASPKAELAAITCQQALAESEFYRDTVGDAGYIANHNTLWSWQSFNCPSGTVQGGFDGNGRSLAYAAKTLTVNGCVSGSGQLCKLSNDRVCLLY